MREKREIFIYVLIVSLLVSGSHVVSNEYWFVSFKVIGSKKKSGWRARVFVLASQCMAFYHMDKSQSIYYDGDDLIIKLLFESLSDSRQFFEELHSIYGGFSWVMPPLELMTAPPPIAINYQPLPVFSNHYDTNEFDSPLHLMNAREYDLNSIRGIRAKTWSVYPVNDPHSRLQMIENMDHPYLCGLPMYRCHHLQSSHASPSNILYMSGLMLERLGDLNPMGDAHLVPSIALKFIKSEVETVEVVKGQTCEQYKVTIGMESHHDLFLLKQGSEYDQTNNRWITFVHVDHDQELKTFLKIKYRVTKELWRQNAPVGEDIDDEQLELLERRATFEVLEEDK